MCGLAGFIGPDRDRVRETTARMTAALAHRGPDADGVGVYPFGDRWLGLGHRRLAIQDLSPLGRNPMRHDPTGCEIVYNGEVYNFPVLRREAEAAGERFKSGSDTEVILAGVARHGPDFFRRLEGMYALAIYDPRGPTLTLARDPAGIKPLFVAEANGCVAFASEVRSVLASGVVPRVVSKAAVGGLLAFGSVPQPLSIVEGVRMQAPGSWRVVRAVPGGIAADPARVWWTPPAVDPAFDARDVVPRLRRMLDEAVRDHLIADVPVGVFLSAGLDSATLAALASRHSKDVRTFTVAVSDQPDFDELTVAAETAKRLGLSHTPIPLPSGEAEAAAAEWFASADQPSLDGLNTFVISKAVRSHGMKVALSGLGADELFGGYPSFREIGKLKAARAAVGWLPAGARRAVARGVAIRKSSEVREKLADLLGGPGDVATMALRRRRVLNDRQMAETGLTPDSCGLSNEWLPPEAMATLPLPDADAGGAISVVESLFYQTNVLLRDSDANGMANALELRVPFLDQRLLDFVHTIPGAVRFPADKPPKHLLREAVGDLLYADLLARPKTGFQLPLRRWMAGPLRPTCEAALRTVRDTGLVAPESVSRIWDQFQANPESGVWSRVLTLVALGDWVGRNVT
jgi:asparagine synthase (glutamine-hydrolysing)